MEKKRFNKMNLLTSIEDSTKQQAVAMLEWIHIFDGREVVLQPDGKYRLRRFDDEPLNFAFGIDIPEAWTEGQV